MTLWSRYFHHVYFTDKLKAREVSFQQVCVRTRINPRPSPFRPCALNTALAAGSGRAPWRRWRPKAGQPSGVGVERAFWLEDMMLAQAQVALRLMWVAGGRVGETGLDQIVESLERESKGAWDGFWGGGGACDECCCSRHNAVAGRWGLHLDSGMGVGGWEGRGVALVLPLSFFSSCLCAGSLVFLI